LARLRPNIDAGKVKLKEKPTIKSPCCLFIIKSLAELATERVWQNMDDMAIAKAALYRLKVLFNITHTGMVMVYHCGKNSY